MDEPYENLTAAIALIDAAVDQISGHEHQEQLDRIRNDLNAERLSLLGGGTARPYHVSDLKLT